jgi:hypothetical protein
LTRKFLDWCSNRLVAALILCALCTSQTLGAEIEASVSISELEQAHWSGPVISNTAFAPTANAGPAHERFIGTISLSETRMMTEPVKFKAAKILGRDPQLFPGVKLPFFTVGVDLVPVTQEVIRVASVNQGQSYWDLIIQPGAVWSVPDDDGWSRAGFPFALVNSLEGETHTGVATFGFKHDKVTNVRVQIVQQTAPFYIADYFTARAQIDAKWRPAPAEGITAARVRYEAALRDRIPIAQWDALVNRLPAILLNNFDDGKDADIVVS